jgi:hypothetical protein
MLTYAAHMRDTKGLQALAQVDELHVCCTYAARMLHVCCTYAVLAQVDHV